MRTGELLLDLCMHGVCVSSLWAGTLIRMYDGGLSKRVVLGKLEDRVRKGRRGKEECATCVERDVRPFNIQPNWRHAAQDFDYFLLIGFSHKPMKSPARVNKVKNIKIHSKTSGKHQ